MKPFITRFRFRRCIKAVLLLAIAYGSFAPVFGKTKPVTPDGLVIGDKIPTWWFPVKGFRGGLPVYVQPTERWVRLHTIC